MRKLILAVAVLAIPATPAGHVGVQPRESKPGVEDPYTVRVPTEAEPAGSKPPGPVTKLVANPSAPTPTSQASDAAAIETWLKGYDAAFNAKDMDKLASFYHPDVTIYEGGGINHGWVDYRDNHLGPELKQFENLQFGHSNTKVHLLPGGQTAYATSEYSLKAKMGEREIDARGLETLVLVKAPDGGWKISHSHTSSRPARRPGPRHDARPSPGSDQDGA